MRGFSPLSWILLGIAIAGWACGRPAEDRSIRDRTEVAFGMTPDQWQELRKRISNLAPGAECTEVVKILGRPHTDKAIAGKRFDAPTTGRILVYYFKQATPGLVNDRLDIYVRLVFDQNNRLSDVTYNGLSRDETR